MNKEAGLLSCTCRCLSGIVLIVEVINHVMQSISHGTHTESDMAVIAIDLVHSHDACLLNIQESRWIRTQGTSSPLGMNLRVNSP